MTDRPTSLQHHPGSGPGPDPVEIRVDAGALSVGALLYGPEDAPPAVLLHGQADSAWSMDSVARPLADRYRVVSLDLRGHGRSDWGAYTLAHFLGDLHGVIEALELTRPVVIGHSLGGQVAAQYCGLFPQVPRAAVLIESLGPPPHRLAAVDPDAHGRRQARQLVDRVRSRARRRTLTDLDEATERLARAHPRLAPNRARLLATTGTEPDPAGGVRWRFDPASRDWLAGHDPERAEQRWRGITCPVQIILGAQAWERYWTRAMFDASELDGPMSVAERDRRLANFADHELVVMDDAGHMVHYDQPDRLNAEIARFLATRIEATAP